MSTLQFGSLRISLLFVGIVLAGSAVATGGCGSSPAPAVVDTDGGGEPNDASQLDASSAQTQDANAANDASAAVDSGFDPAVAHPPAGFVLCKSGVFDLAAARAACNAITNPFATQAKSCDGASMTNGSYQVWCNGQARYSWARFEGVQRTLQFPNCPMGVAFVGAARASTGPGGAASGPSSWNTSSCLTTVGENGCSLNNDVSAVVTMERPADPNTTTQSFYVTLAPSPATCVPQPTNLFPHYTLGYTIVF